MDLTEKWQDHGLGLLRTIMHQANLPSDVRSVRSINSEQQLPALLSGYDMLIMNVRSYNWPIAKIAANIFKKITQGTGIVIAGGMHATVSPEQMLAFPNIDHICAGSGEKTIVDLAADPNGYPKFFHGEGAKSMDDWPIIDRTLWPNPHLSGYPFPLEPAIPSWGPSPVVTLLSSRVCPWRCSFCNEASYIPNQQRRSVDSIIEELNWLDENYGPIGSLVFHDSMFFRNSPGIRA